MRRLAIIPARGGSKRIPNKNLRHFCDQPMIAHILNAARESQLFDKVHVSTDSEEIREVVSKFGYPPDFTRPSELADDHTPIMPVLKFVLTEYKKINMIYDEVWLLMACAPLITHQDLTKAAKLFQNTKNEKPLITIAEYPAPIEWAFRSDEKGKLTPVQTGMFSVRSQDLEKHYFDSGSFAIFPSSYILQSNGAGSDLDYIGYNLPKSTAIDIDEEEDWLIAEAIFEYRQRKNKE